MTPKEAAGIALGIGSELPLYPFAIFAVLALPAAVLLTRTWLRGRAKFAAAIDRQAEG